MAEPFVPNPNLVALFPLQEQLINKTTGLPLSAGTVTFYRDQDRTVTGLKNVYQQVQNPDHTYSYVSVGSQLTLGGGGTYVDNSGNDFIPFLYPFTGSPSDPEVGEVDLYYITVYAANPPVSDGSLQLTREAWPPGFNGGTGPTGVFEGSENELTNPQFVEVNFSPLNNTVISVTGASTITSVAPGWDLVTSGTGTITLGQVAIGVNPLDSNPPYALQINSSGGALASILLRQRLYNSPRLLANGFVTGYMTASSLDNGAHLLQAFIQYSTVAPLPLFSYVTTTDGTFTAPAQNARTISTTTLSTDTATAGYTDFYVVIPVGAHLQLSSFQITSVETINDTVEFLQLSTARQKDHLFHYYENELIIKPKNTILTGWNFPLNPFQNITTTITNAAANQYVCDQTILIQQQYVNGGVGNHVATGLNATLSYRNGLCVKAVTTTNQFALLQYVDQTTFYPYWGYYVSSLMRALYIPAGASAPPQFKMRLIVNNTEPTVTTQTYPVASWAANGEPVLNGGFSAIAPLNDPIYTIGTSTSAPEGATSFPAYPFNGMLLSNLTNAAQTVGILVYSLNSMNVNDQVIFDSISLVPNQFAVDASPTTFDEELRKCWYYYESSNPLGTLVTNGSISGYVLKPMAAWGAGGAFAGNGTMYTTSFDIEYKEPKRVAPDGTTASLKVYDTGGTIDQVTALIRKGGGAVVTGALSYSNWDKVNQSNYSSQWRANNTASGPTTGVAMDVNTQAWIDYHYVANVRIG